MLVAKTWPACEKLIGQPISVVIVDAMSAGALLQRGQQAVEHVGALGRRAARPRAFVEGLARRRDGAVDVGLAGLGDASDDFLGERRAHVDEASG